MLNTQQKEHIGKRTKKIYKIKKLQAKQYITGDQNSFNFLSFRYSVFSSFLFPRAIYKL
jgi:hypothetical protein